MTELPLKVGQYALITNSKKEILILERKRSKKWSFPGGRLNSHERDWFQALKREIFEETGLEIEKAGPYQVNIVEDLPYQVKYCVYFLVSLSRETNIKLEDEHSSFLWVHRKNIDLIEFEYPFLKKMIVECLGLEQQ